MSTSLFWRRRRRRERNVSRQPNGGGFDLTCKADLGEFAGDWRYRETHAGNVYTYGGVGAVV